MPRLYTRRPHTRACRGATGLLARGQEETNVAHIFKTGFSAICRAHSFGSLHPSPYAGISPLLQLTLCTTWSPWSLRASGKPYLTIIEETHHASALRPVMTSAAPSNPGLALAPSPRTAAPSYQAWRPLCTQPTAAPAPACDRRIAAISFLCIASTVASAPILVIISR